MSSILFLAGAGIVRMDMMLTFFVTLALYYFWEAFHNNRKKYYNHFWIATGFSVLTKGPLGLAFPVLAVIVTVFARRDWTKLKHLFLNWGFILFFPMGVGWLVAAWFAGYQDFVNNIIFKQVLERATDSFIHKQPFYFYLILLPALFLPWFFYLPRAIYHLWKSEEKESVHFLLIWFGTGLLTISLISGKLFIYLLPVFPPLALLLGKHLWMIIRNNNSDKGFSIESLFTIFLFYGIFIATPLIVPQYLDISNFPLYLLSISSVLFLIVGLVYIIRHYKFMLLLLLFLSVGFYNTYIFLGIAPRLNSFLSSRTVSEEVAQLAEEGYQVGVHGGRRGLFSFYANQKIPEIPVDQLQQFLEKSPKHILLLKVEDINRFQKNEELSGELKIIYSRNVANIIYNLVKQNE
jgi:4-amino-4-deoxy-L-arabinose transferase-like glycosyltransferase